MDTTKLEKWTGNLLVFLAVGAFILSFAGMYAVAVDAGYGWLSYLWPLVTESAVVIFSLLYLVAKLKDYENKYLMPVIVGCTVLSVVFNVWHAPSDLLSRAVYALPPIFLFAAFKGYLWKVEQDTKRAGQVASLLELTRQLAERTEALEKAQEEERQLSTIVETITRQIEAARAELKRVQAEIEAGKVGQNVATITEMNEARQAKIEARRQDVLNLVREGFSHKEIATRLEVSERTVRNDVAALNGQVAK